MNERTLSFALILNGVYPQICFREWFVINWKQAYSLSGTVIEVQRYRGEKMITDTSIWFVAGARSRLTQHEENRWGKS